MTDLKEGAGCAPTEMKSSSLCSVLKFVYLTSQLHHSLVVSPCKKNPGFTPVK